MRIVSYNIRKAVGLDWRRDPDRVVDILLEIGADVIVLQEADKRFGQRAGVLPLDRMRREGGYRLIETSERQASHGWHGNALFARQETPVAETSRLPLPSLEPRGAVSAVFAPPGLEVIGTHLALLPRTRRQQMKRLHAYAISRPHPVLVAGDFNDWRPEDSGLTDGWTSVMPGPSFHAARPVASLDGFLLSGAVHHSGARVHRCARAARGSDHLPVVIDLQIPQPAGPE